METIKTYIENMFLNLPSTPEVQKAKRELLCMMEDKYTELKEEGKTENEAVGIVISEFGNLDEIAESLGISEVVNPQEKNEENTQADADNMAGSGSKGGYQGAQEPRRLLTLERAKEYISYKLRHCKFIALGVMLCIFSPVWCIFFDAVGENFGGEDVLDALGATLLFLTVAVAVILFVMSGSLGKEWEWIERKRFVSDFATLAYVEKEKKEFRSKYAVFMSVGISLCIISVIPPIIMDSLDVDFLDDISGGLLLIMVGAGVFLIVMCNMIMDTYENLLKNSNKYTFNPDRNAVGIDYSDVPSAPGNGAEFYTDKMAKEDETQKEWEVFWPTVSCIYLCLSFLTFRWNVTWIIWPIASVIYALIKSFNK